MNGNGTRFACRCKLCPPGDEGQLKLVADSAALNIPLFGVPGRDTGKLMEVLLKHLTKKHKDLLDQGAALAQEFQPYMIFSAFEHEEPTINPRLALIRAAIFQQVRLNTVTDADIADRVARLGLDSKDAAKVIAAMKDQRDFCCEFGAYAPRVPEPAKV